MTYKNDPVPARVDGVGLVARCGSGPWYRVGGWAGSQPLVWLDGQLSAFNGNQVVEVVYDPKLWEVAT